MSTGAAKMAAPAFDWSIKLKKDENNISCPRRRAASGPFIRRLLLVGRSFVCRPI